MEWKSSGMLAKSSRIDEAVYQAFVPDKPTGTMDDLSKASIAIAKRCKYQVDEGIKKVVADDFIQFVRWLMTEQVCNTSLGP